MLPEPMIQVEGLSRIYGSGENRVPVFENLQFEVGRGEMLFITGPSGVGKSTLLHILGGLDAPTSGKVVVDNVEISSLNEEARVRFRRKRIGIVFQFHHLLDEFNVLENISIPLLILGEKKKKARDQARELLARLEMNDKEKRFPAELSGGEQQRVALARAIVTAPHIILADEPTGNLDKFTEDQAMRLFKELHGQNGWTSVIVTHNEHLLPYADRCLHFEEDHLREIDV